MASHSLRVLVVDDNLDTCEAFSALLTIYGHVTVAVQSGLKAIELAQAQTWNLALVDLGLPDLDGYEVARHIRASRGAAIKLVAVSGHGGQAAADRAKEAGFDEYHLKPLDMTVFERLLS